MVESTGPTKRQFSRSVQKECWEKLLHVPGRDPNRFRFDATGQNIVCSRLNGCLGCLCYEYDHIVPFSKGGLSILENCQVLQTRVNRLKANQDDLSNDRMRLYSCSYSFNDRELDAVEMSIFGDIKRPEKECRCKSWIEMTHEWMKKVEGKHNPINCERETL